MSAVATPQDRTLSVPPGKIVKTGYVHVFNVELACRERMAVGDVAGAFQKLICLGDHSPWLPPNGYWLDNGKFRIVDGRHEWVASVMLGKDYMLVAWLADQD